MEFYRQREEAEVALGVVQTKYGKVSGITYDGRYTGITEYRGIPYAAPPVGRLRFAPPQEPEEWTGIKDCSSYAPAAVQTMLSDRHAREYYFQGTPKMSEDCLYVNVCSGAVQAGEKRPVYMWFHGGGLTNCFSYEIQCNPQELARKGVVVVSVGQRLNLFGYLCLPQLTKEQGKSGNYGFMDQIKALDWVTENIEAFGGDPENITVGGQSGGALKCCLLAASPAARGRIKRVINQSGNKWMIPLKSLEDQEKLGRRYLQYAGIDPDITLEELRAMDTWELYQDAPRVVMPGDVVWDGDLIPCKSVRELFETCLGDVDFMNGADSGEAEVFGESASGLNEVPVRKFISQIRNSRDFYGHFRNLLGLLYEKYDFESLVKVTDDTAWDTARLLAGRGLCGSEGMNVSRNLMLNRYFGMYMHKKHPGNSYYSYWWTHLLPCLSSDKNTSADTERTLAWHSTELWFTFGSLREGIPPHRPWRNIDYEIADAISSYWANFIKCGNPNGEGLPVWPKSNDNYGYMELGDDFLGKNGVDEPLEKLILEFITREYQLMDGDLYE